jgi:hypothetical protein
MVIWRPELCNRKEYLMSTSVALQGPSFSHTLSHCNANYHFRLLIFLKIYSVLSGPLVEAQLTGLSIKISYRFWPALSWHGTRTFSCLIIAPEIFKTSKNGDARFYIFFKTAVPPWSKRSSWHFSLIRNPDFSLNPNKTTGHCTKKP